MCSIPHCIKLITIIIKLIYSYTHSPFSYSTVHGFLTRLQPHALPYLFHAELNLLGNGMAQQQEKNWLELSERQTENPIILNGRNFACLVFFADPTDPRESSRRR